MNFLNTVSEATLTDALLSAAPSSSEPLTIIEALKTSVTGIVVVMIILALLAVLVVILSKIIRAFESVAKKKENKDETVRPANENKADSKADSKGTTLPDTQSAGNLELYKTDEKTAAVIMAIVSNESGIPLNRLQFNSIKLLEDKGE